MIIDVGIAELRYLAILLLVWLVGSSTGQTTQSLLALVFLQLALGIISDASVTALLIIILAVALIREMLRFGRGAK
jgi:hypothetical protein